MFHRDTNHYNTSGIFNTEPHDVIHLIQKELPLGMAHTATDVFNQKKDLGLLM